jgi:hypothetical protein
MVKENPTIIDFLTINVLHDDDDEEGGPGAEVSEGQDG